MKKQLFVLAFCTLGLTAMAQGVNMDNSIENAFSFGSGVSDAGLVAYYTFNGDASDRSGNGNNGTVNRATVTDGYNGEASGAYAFGGPHSPGSIRVPKSESLRIGNEWTFAAYVKPLGVTAMDGYGNNSSTGAQTIMAKSHDRSGFVIMYNLNGDKFNTWMGGFASWTKGINANMPGSYLSQWVHVAYVYSNGEFRIYLNGELKSTKQVTPDFSRANNEDMYLGKFSDYWYPMNGALDEVRIYNRALDGLEIQTLSRM